MHLIFFFALIGSFIASSSAGIVFKSGPLQARGEISAASLWFKDQAVPAEVSGPFMFFDVQEMKNHVVAVSTSDIEFISHANTACSRGAIAIVIVNDARIVGDGCIQYLAEGAQSFSSFEKLGIKIFCFSPHRLPLRSYMRYTNSST
mmetsp:Transcript_14944/g.16614  ORF Transcript_14944/g.16614 Transcript_14944/m.16614 type:complete len:147 (+) Transcript_14944:114-554(+)